MTLPVPASNPTTSLSYSLKREYNGIEHFRSDDLDHLMNDRGYFRKSILLAEREKEI